MKERRAVFCVSVAKDEDNGTYMAAVFEGTEPSHAGLLVLNEAWKLDDALGLACEEVAETLAAVTKAKRPKDYRAVEPTGRGRS